MVEIAKNEDICLKVQKEYSKDQRDEYAGAEDDGFSEEHARGAGGSNEKDPRQRSSIQFNWRDNCSAHRRASLSVSLG